MWSIWQLDTPTISHELTAFSIASTAYLTKNVLYGSMAQCEYRYATSYRETNCMKLKPYTRFTFAWQESHRLPFARQMRNNLSQTLLCCMVRGFCFWVVRGSSNIAVLSWAPCEALVDQLRWLAEVHTDRKKFDEIQKCLNSQQLFNYSWRLKNE